ncbi:DUF5074 domain-containing protein [Bacteroides gallinaceum]|uniref:Lipoprotein n=1 Tax=Bacteroides gallinaceum TaxID=1462571 RepID=A0ABT7VE56_9BACE|nr:hypothetical protein [Bacteroides gallinaceum]MDM8324582.1 hypothetical protein [Bacteroides gallinaceum]
MNVKSFLIGMLCLLATGVSFVSCNDDNDDFLDDTGSKVSLPGRRAYILYEGSYGQGNSGLAFYAPDGNADFIGDIYTVQNGKGLGDTGSAMIEHDDNIYVVVSGSSYVARLNAAGVEQCRHEFEYMPRYIDAEDGYVYVTQYGGRVSKLDAVTLDEVGVYQGQSDHAYEGIVECNGLLYVADSQTRDESATVVLGYNSEVLVIDPNSMQLKQTVSVTVNPERLWECDGKVYLISRDVYDLTSYQKISRNELQIIDPSKGNQVTEIKEATKLAKGDNGLLYLIDTDTENSFFTYNISTGKITDHTFLNNNPEELSSATIYLFEVDDETGDIYIGTSDYVSEGTVYRFDASGTFKEKFDAGGINPNSMIFVD